MWGEVSRICQQAWKASVQIEDEAAVGGSSSRPDRTVKLHAR